MRSFNIIFTLLLLAAFSKLYSQQTEVSVINHQAEEQLSWQIVDTGYHVLFSDDVFKLADTIHLWLPSGERYFFQVSIPEEYDADTLLISLSLDDEVILIIKGEVEPGDHAYPFYTGLSSQQVRIVGGSDAHISQFPWQVFLRSGQYSCGGSIIGKQFVLTAAHCLFDRNNRRISASEMTVKVGASDARDSSEGKIFQVDTAIVHHSYKPGSLQNDIALLKLTDSINFPNARPIGIISTSEVNEGATDPGVMAWVTGWGITDPESNQIASILQKVQLPIVSNETAAEVWGNIPQIFMVAGYEEADKDACSGDSGGPLVVPVGDGFKQAGIVSWGSEDCNTYGVYTRISEYLTWISDNSGIEDEFRLTTPIGDNIVCQGTESTEYTTEFVPEVSYYEWELLPAEAGDLDFQDATATVSWNENYLGDASIRVRALYDGMLSDWSEQALRIAQSTVLLEESRDTSLCEGGNITLRVRAEGDLLVYKWYKNGGLFSTQSTGSVPFNNIETVNSGIYHCEVTGSCGTVISDDIDVIVYENTEITNTSQDVITFEGESALITVNARGQDLSYEWSMNGEVLPDKSGFNILINNVTANDIGNYRVTVSGICGTEISDPVYLFVGRNAESIREDISANIWPTITDGPVSVAISSDDRFDVYLYNTNGQIIFIKKDCRFRQRINKTGLVRGAYILKIVSDDYEESFKFVIP